MKTQMTYWSVALALALGTVSASAQLFSPGNPLAGLEKARTFETIRES